ncbi:MAG: hypothetical protein GX752_00330 [Clostridium sp.]|nr:hypothetical protein [Clostridium sp.]
MAIKLIDVYNELSAYSSTLYSKDGGQSLIIDSEVLNPDIKIIRKNVLYMCRASSLVKVEKEKLSRCNLIIIKDDEYNLEDLSYNRVNIIECNPETSFEELFQSLKNIFIKDYALLDSSAILLDALINEKAIEEMAVISSDLLYNPIIIIDSGFKVLAHSDKKDIKESYWIDSIERGYCSYEFIATVRQIDAFKKSPNNNNPFIVICEQSPIRKLISKIIIDGNVVAYVLVLESETSFKDNHYQITKLLSDVLSQKLKKDPFYRNSRELIYENLIIDILESNIKDKESLRERSKDIFIEDNLYLLTFKMDKYDSSNVAANSLEMFLDEILPIHKSVFFENYILILLSFEGDFLKHFKENDKFISFIEKQNITISVSSKFADILDLPHIYRQCVDTLDIIAKLNLKENLYSNEDFKFYNILHNINSEINILDFCSSKLLKIIDWDKENDTEYFDTIRSYLKANRNAVQSSKDLFIHRNTINYRLNKIKEIADIDFDDMEELFMINTSIKILEYTGLL